jgi:hypothetical protein
MAHSLILDDLNGGTVDLNDGSLITLMHYTPLSMDSNAETVVDTIKVKFDGNGTQLTFGTSIQAVNRLLRQGERFVENGVTNQVFLKYQPHGYASAWYSPVVSAKLELDSEATDLAQWTNGKTVFADLVVERKNYWEAETSVAIMGNVTLINGSALYYGITGTAMLGAAASGDLPSPALMLFDVGTIGAITKLYMAVWQDKSGTVGLLAGGTPVYKECDAWGTIYGGSAVADASCSQGTAYQRVLTSTTSTTIGTLATPFTGLNLAGNNVRAWMRFGTITSTNIQYQIGVRIDPTSSNDIWNSAWITPGTQDYIQDFGVVDFSVCNIGSAPVAYLYSRLSSGTIGTARLDYWILAPYDSYFSYQGINSAATAAGVWSGYCSAYASGTNRILNTTRTTTNFMQDWYAKYDQYLYLNPNQAAVFYMQAIGVNGTATPTLSWVIHSPTIYPRKLNI